MEQMTPKGYLFLLVGNSGSGKDSLINETVKLWPADQPPLMVPERYITRAQHPSEPYHSVSPDRFISMKQAGRFCLTWTSYDIDYGVPKEVLGWLDQGRLVLVNVSRQILSPARATIAHVKVVFVYVPMEITLERVRQRGREKTQTRAFQERARRARAHQHLKGADFTVDNSGSLADSAKALRDYLLSHVGP
jgi:ribose 1,5-bisphosphokinase